MEKTIYKCDARTPFDWLCEEPWGLIAQCAEPNAYAELDDVYQFLLGEIDEEEFIDRCPDLEPDRESLIAFYNEGIAQQIADTLKGLATEIEAGDTVFNFQF